MRSPFNKKMIVTVRKSDAQVVKVHYIMWKLPSNDVLPFEYPREIHTSNDIKKFLIENGIVSKGVKIWAKKSALTGYIYNNRYHNEYYDVEIDEKY